MHSYYWWCWEEPVSDAFCNKTTCCSHSYNIYEYASFHIFEVGSRHDLRQLHFRGDDRFTHPVKYEEACITQGLHEGNAIDIGSYGGKRVGVVAIADGEVLMTCRGVADGDPSTECGQCGNFIRMKNAAGVVLYCHLTDRTLLVKKGDKVTKG